MTSLAVKILKDEDGNNFVPYTSTIALYDPDGETISDKIAKKLETSSLIAGTGITLIPDITNHTVEIQSSIPGANLINNLTTSVIGQGALDAYQGYVLNTTKQDTLVSGQNIKTINGSSVLGSGDLTIDTGGNYTAGKGISISDSGEVSVTNPVPDSLRLYNYDIGIKTKAQIESDDTFKKLCYQIAESPWDCILYLYTSGNRDTDNSVKNIIGAYHKTYYTIFGSGTIKAIFTQMNNSANFGITGNQVEIDGCNLSTIQIVIPLDAESQQTSDVTINVGSDINYSVPTYTAGEGIVIDENNVISTTGSGTNNYNNLSNKPSINGVVLEGNKTSEDLGLADNKILWQGEWYMNGSQTANLSQKVSEQQHGIVLVWQAYDNGSAKNWHFNYNFIPKWHTLYKAGTGVSLWLTNDVGSQVASKYIYVYDDKLVGHDNNSSGETSRGSGINVTNNHWVLTCVLGV